MVRDAHAAHSGTAGGPQQHEFRQRGIRCGRSQAGLGGKKALSRSRSALATRVGRSREPFPIPQLSQAVAPLQLPRQAASALTS